MGSTAPGTSNIGAAFPRPIDLDDVKTLVSQVERNGRRLRRDDFDAHRLRSDLQGAVNWLFGYWHSQSAPSPSAVRRHAESVRAATDRLLRLVASDAARDLGTADAALWSALLEHLPPFEGGPQRDNPLESDPAASARGLIEGLRRLREIAQRLEARGDRKSERLKIEHFVGWHLADIYIRHFAGPVGTGVGPFTRFASIIINDFASAADPYMDTTLAAYVKDMQTADGPRDRRSKSSLKTTRANAKKK